MAREYREGAHTVYDIKMHLVWMTKYRHKVLRGEVGTRTRDLIRQVWYNLLSNAVKYTSARPVAEISVGMEVRDGQEAYYVRDNGAGFDMKYAGRLFEVFQRLHTTEQFEGSGIGLATVHKIIQRHGGRIWADAQPDQGATFFFTLGGTAAVR